MVIEVLRVPARWWFLCIGSVLVIITQLAISNAYNSYMENESKTAKDDLMDDFLKDYPSSADSTPVNGINGKQKKNAEGKWEWTGRKRILKRLEEDKKTIGKWQEDLDVAREELDTMIEDMENVVDELYSKGSESVKAIPGEQTLLVKFLKHKLPLQFAQLLKLKAELGFKYTRLKSNSCRISGANPTQIKKIISRLKPLVKSVTLETRQGGDGEGTLSK